MSDATAPLTSPPPRPRVAIVGGGVAGLAAALALDDADAAVDWRLFEASPRLGGVLETVQRDGYLIERSADNFLTREPWATALCERVGVAAELLPTDERRRRALVVARGRVRPVPEGFVLMQPKRSWPVMTSPILSPWGKARLACEPLIRPRREESDESVASFARRRLGREAFERLVQPLVAGIYTADPDRLSMAATMPQFARQEREHGGLVRAAWRQRKRDARDRGESGARYGLFVAPRRGMQQMVDALAAALPAERVETGVAVERLERGHRRRWRLRTASGAESEHDAVILATPSYHAAEIVRTADAALADALSAVEYAGASVVCLGVNASQVARPVEGFGFVVPAVERRRIIAASFSSHKFPGRAPDGRLLIRVFVGGALQPELADLEDDALVRLAREELGELVGLTGEPHLSLVARWERRMPQYHVGHLGRVAAIEAHAQRVGVELAGAAYRGVGVPQCVHSGQQAAGRVLAKLTAQ